jgi:hypothetical protein
MGNGGFTPGVIFVTIPYAYVIMSSRIQLLVLTFASVWATRVRLSFHLYHHQYTRLTLKNLCRGRSITAEGPEIVDNCEATQIFTLYTYLFFVYRAGTGSFKRSTKRGNVNFKRRNQNVKMKSCRSFPANLTSHPRLVSQHLA